MNKAFLSLLLVAGFGCAAAFAQGETGTVTTTTNFVFPPVGLVSGETAAVSLVNIAPAPTSTTATAPSCTGTVTFAGPTGTTIGTASPFTVGSGQIKTISLPFATAGITSTRGEILVSVQQTTTRPSTAACSLVFSLEVYDSTGETHVLMGNAAATTPPSNSPEPLH
jgi:hypothetical protein